MRSVLLSSIVSIDGEGIAYNHFPLSRWRAALSLALTRSSAAARASSDFRTAVVTRSKVTCEISSVKACHWLLNLQDCSAILPSRCAATELGEKLAVKVLNWHNDPRWTLVERSPMDCIPRPPHPMGRVACFHESPVRLGLRIVLRHSRSLSSIWRRRSPWASVSEYRRM